jgi:putative DNA primase/helicase
MKKNADQNTNDIARLRGARFVTTTEAEQGRRLSEPLIKEITGNDQIPRVFCMGSILTLRLLSKFLWLRTISL